MREGRADARFKNRAVGGRSCVPVFLFHFVLVLVLWLVWLDFAAYQDTFRAQWLQLQLEAIGGLDATLVYDNSTGAGAPTTLLSANAWAARSTSTSRRSRATCSSRPTPTIWGGRRRCSRCSAAGAAASRVRRRGVRDHRGGADAGGRVKLPDLPPGLPRWCASSSPRLIGDGGSRSTCASRRTPSPSTCRRWRRSITSSLIGVAGTINGGFFNAFTQSKEGYRIVKRDSSLVSLMTHGVPILGIAAAAASSPAYCQHLRAASCSARDAAARDVHGDRRHRARRPVALRPLRDAWLIACAHRSTTMTRRRSARRPRTRPSRWWWGERGNTAWTWRRAARSSSASASLCSSCSACCSSTGTPTCTRGAGTCARRSTSASRRRRSLCCRTTCRRRWPRGDGDLRARDGAQRLLDRVDARALVDRRAQPLAPEARRVGGARPLAVAGAPLEMLTFVADRRVDVVGHDLRSSAR